tara:strand:- start:1855 stop:2043 length:189 start_codon:yes stop_codon:yes gene_type:complete
MYAVKEIEVLGKTKLELALKYLYKPKSKIIPTELKDLTELQWILLNHILEELMDEQEDSTIH